MRVDFDYCPKRYKKKLSFRAPLNKKEEGTKKYENKKEKEKGETRTEKYGRVGETI